MKRKYDIKISEFNSAGICAAAHELRIKYMRLIGGGYIKEHEGECDWYVSFYALPHPNGKWEFRVANTNSDPIWEEADTEEFADLAQRCNVEI